MESDDDSGYAESCKSMAASDESDNVPRFDDLRISRRLGQGTFGTVHLAKTVCESACRRFAVKQLKRTVSPSVVAMELKVMRQFGGIRNIMPVVTAERRGQITAILMPYFAHDSFKEIVATASGAEVVHYMAALLDALAYLHASDVVHRDVKPSNFLYNRRQRQYRLCDFGLARELPMPQSPTAKRAVLGELGNVDAPATRPHRLAKRALPFAAKRRVFNGRVQKPSRAGGGGGKEHICTCSGKPRTCGTCRTRRRARVDTAGTPGYRAPESLLPGAELSSAVDVWAAGVMLMSLLSGRHSLFRPANDRVALAQICTLFGAERVRRLADKMGRRLIVKPASPGVDLVKLCSALRNAGRPSAPPPPPPPPCAVCAPFVGGARAQCVCSGGGAFTDAPTGRFADLSERQLICCFGALDRMLQVDVERRWPAFALFEFVGTMSHQLKSAGAI